MIQTQQVVIKTTGTIIDEFQQLVSGIALSKVILIPVLFMTSKEFKEQFNEYFDFTAQFVELQDILKTSYVYNPGMQEECLNTMELGPEYTSFIYESSKEFKRDDVSVMDYMRLKSAVHNELFKSVHSYVFPQLEMLFDDEKINVGLSYNEADLSEIYDKCTVDVYNYVDISNKTALVKSNVNKYELIDVLLKYITLSMCDMVMGDCSSILNYEVSFRRYMMVHNLTKLPSEQNSNHIVPSQVVFNNECMFPNSQLLLKYI
jgi:hypothetical protein